MNREPVGHTVRNVAHGVEPDVEPRVEPYVVKRPSRSRFISVRGLRHHLLEWGDAAMVTPERPTLLMQHGWMDVAASFQFVVDALPTDRHVLAFDWRGFGLSDAPVTDTYWLPDYLGDLDGALDALFFDGAALFPGVSAIDLLGHSMGGNATMLYAGLRPERIRRLVNLEGFGMPATQPSQSPKRIVQWLDEIKRPAVLRDYTSLAEVAERLRKTNPLLPMARAAWLAQHWSRPTPDGRFEILADPAHKRGTPTLYQRDEALAAWKLITAKVLWVEGDRTDLVKWWGTRYSKAEFHERLNVVRQVERHTLSPAGHMLHHDQPEALAQRLEAFLAP